MSRPFWFAATSGTLFGALAINRFAQSTTEAGQILAVLVWALVALALIDIFATTPKPPTPRNP
jgi:hypothetical protein